MKGVFMGKIAVMAALLCLLGAFAVQAGTINNSNVEVGVVSGSGGALIHSGAGHLLSLIIKTDGVNPVTVNLFDGVNASGSYLIPVDTVIPEFCTFGLPFKFLPDGIHFKTGLYIEIVTAGTCSYQAVTY